MIIAKRKLPYCKVMSLALSGTASAPFSVSMSHVFIHFGSKTIHVTCSVVGLVGLVLVFTDLSIPIDKQVPYAFG